MEDLVLSIPTQDAVLVESLAQRMGWTMRRRVHSVRRVATTNNKREVAMLFVQNLSVHGGQPIPVEERGIEALVNEKYNK